MAVPKTLAAKQFYIGNVGFGSVAGDGVVQVKDLLTTTADPGEYDTMESEAPRLDFLKPTGLGYNSFYYISDAYDGDDEVTGWCDMYGDISYDEIPCGTAFWYIVPESESTYTTAGEVLSDATVTKDVDVNKFMLIGNPWPIALSLKNLITTLPAGEYDTMESAAPRIDVLKPTGLGYKSFYYISDAYEGDNEVTGWADMYGDIPEEASAVAQEGFWVISPTSNGKITFTK